MPPKKGYKNNSSVKKPAKKKGKKGNNGHNNPCPGRRKLRR
jgi:hypothetical protein